MRREIWRELDAHDGPVIWAANHLTLIDSFLIFEALVPISRTTQARRLPWSTPEYRNYYRLGGFVRQRLIRLLMYLCRCIPFLRGGEDEASVLWRERAFAKLVQVLRGGGTVFVYPEAGRSRSGWFEKSRPKDFLGRLALEAPAAKFLCVYLRADDQQFATVIPERGSIFRVRARLIDAVKPGETTARQISQRLFSEIALLQDEWWKQSPLPKNCAGNDVVDLKHPLLRENIDPESGDADERWLSRHLTAKELAYWRARPAADRYRSFWTFFAAKEASHKALVQAGLADAAGGFLQFEVDLFRRKAMHVPTGAQTDLALADDQDKVHCVAILRGGYIGDDAVPSDALWQVETIEPGTDASVQARERCLAFIAASSDDIASPACLAFDESRGFPRVLRGGKVMDWSVSLSHSGRYVAFSLLAG